MKSLLFDFFASSLVILTVFAVIMGAIKMADYASQRPTKEPICCPCCKKD